MQKWLTDCALHECYIMQSTDKTNQSIGDVLSSFFKHLDFSYRAYPYKTELLFYIVTFWIINSLVHFFSNDSIYIVVLLFYYVSFHFIMPLLFNNSRTL